MDQRGDSAPNARAGDDPHRPASDYPWGTPADEDYGSYPPWDEYAEQPATNDPPGIQLPDPTWAPPTWISPHYQTATTALTIPPATALDDAMPPLPTWPDNGAPDANDDGQPDAEGTDAAWAAYWARQSEYTSDTPEPASDAPYPSDPTPSYDQTPCTYQTPYTTAPFAEAQRPYEGYGIAPPYAPGPATAGRDRNRNTGLIALLIAVAAALAIAILAIAGWLAFGRGGSATATPLVAVAQQAPVGVPTAAVLPPSARPTVTAPSATGPTVSRALNVPIILPPTPAIPATVAGGTALAVPVILPPTVTLAPSTPAAVPTEQPTPTDVPATDVPATDVPAPTEAPAAPAPIIVNNPAPVVVNNPPPPPAPTSPPTPTAVPTVAVAPTSPPPTPAAAQKPQPTFPALPPTLAPARNTLPAGFAQPGPPRPINTPIGGG